MTPTQEQIEAALIWATYDPCLPSIGLSKQVVTTLDDYCRNEAIEVLTLGACRILAAAYREAMAEIASLKKQRNEITANLAELSCRFYPTSMSDLLLIEKCNASLVKLKEES